MSSTATSSSLFEIDAELNDLLDQIQEQFETEGQASEDLLLRFNEFCQAYGEKVDRIGRFVRMMEAREQYCRSEAARLSERAKTASNKAERTKSLVLYYLMSRDLKKVEGQEFTLREQKNSQDSVRILDETAVPTTFCKIEAKVQGSVWNRLLAALPDDLARTLTASIQSTRPDSDAIKTAFLRNEQVPGVSISRGSHLRVG